MAKKTTAKAKAVSFDPKTFLATVNGGRSASEYQIDETIFLQGDPADAVFYIQSGKVKIAVTSNQVTKEKRRWSPSLGSVSFSGKDV